MLDNLREMIEYENQTEEVQDLMLSFHFLLIDV